MPRYTRIRRVSITSLYHHVYHRSLASSSLVLTTLLHLLIVANEILNDFADKSLDYFVTGYGTGGTVTGIGQVLREKSPKTKIVLSEPDVAQLIASGVKQQRNEDNTPAVSHEAWLPHPIQGWTPGKPPLPCLLPRTAPCAYSQYR